MKKDKDFYHAKTKYLLDKFNYYAEKKSVVCFIYAFRILLIGLVLRFKFKEDYYRVKYQINT